MHRGILYRKLAQLVFSSEICYTFKNTYFEKDLRATAFVFCIGVLQLVQFYTIIWIFGKGIFRYICSK